MSRQSPLAQHSLTPQPNSRCLRRLSFTAAIGVLLMVRALAAFSTGTNLDITQFRYSGRCTGPCWCSRGPASSGSYLPVIWSATARRLSLRTHRNASQSPLRDSDLYARFCMCQADGGFARASPPCPRPARRSLLQRRRKGQGLCTGSSSVGGLAQVGGPSSYTIQLISFLPEFACLLTKVSIDRRPPIMPCCPIVASNCSSGGSTPAQSSL